MPAEALATETQTAQGAYNVPFSVVKQGDGRFIIRDVPIFTVHDSRGYDCNSEWMIQAVATQRAEKREGFLPRLIIGHNADEPEVTGEKQVVAYLDNYRFDQVDGHLYADYVNVPKDLMEMIQQGKYPGRSVEVYPDDPAVRVVAMLGGSEPCFKMPDLRFSSTKLGRVTQRLLYKQEIYFMPHDPSIDPGGGAGTEPGMADPDEAQFKVFLKFMERFKAMQEGDQDGEAPVEEVVGFDAHGDDDEKKKDFSGHEDDDKKEKEGFSAAGVPNRNALIERIDALEIENQRLDEAREVAKYEAFYAESGIPATRLDPKEHIAFMMGIPKDKREAYAKNIVSAIAMPSTDPVDSSDHVSDPRDGSAQTYKAIKDKWDSDPALKAKYLTYGAYLAAIKKQKKAA